MKICGIELKGNEALICCIDGQSITDYQLIAKQTKKIILKESLDQASIHQFQHDMIAFLEEHEIDAVAIKARATKGRFAGGSVSFKMEALIQNTKVLVKIINGSTIKAKLKNHQNNIDFNTINAYQKEALMSGLYLLA